jgi:hypothetical protein
MIILRNLNGCKQLLESFPVDLDREEAGFLAIDSDDDEEKFRGNVSGSNLIDFLIDPNSIDYLTL